MLYFAHNSSSSSNSDPAEMYIIGILLCFMMKHLNQLLYGKIVKESLIELFGYIDLWNLCEKLSNS